MGEYRPKIAMQKTTLQKIANLIGYGLFIGFTVYSLFNLSGLPSQVPIHFNIFGEADGWGPKYVLLFFPIIVMLIGLAFEALEKRPHIHNYPEHMNELNVQQYYAISIRTVNLMKNTIFVIFGLIQIEIVQVAQQAKFIDGNILFAAFIVAMIVSIVWHIFSIIRIKQNI